MDEREVRGDGGQSSGPRRVGEARRDREAGSASSDAHRDADRDTSWVSVVFGWLAALGAGGIVSGIVGAIFGSAGRQGLAEGGMTALIGLLLLALLVPLACQALSGDQGSGSRTRRRKRKRTRSGMTSKPAGDSQEADAGERDQADSGPAPSDELPEGGGVPTGALLALGAAMLLGGLALLRGVS